MRKLQEQGCKAAEIYISAGGNQDRAGEGKFLKAERAIFAEEPPQARKGAPRPPWWSPTHVGVWCMPPSGTILHAFSPPEGPCYCLMDHPAVATLQRVLCRHCHLPFMLLPPFLACTLFILPDLSLPRLAQRHMPPESLPVSRSPQGRHLLLHCPQRSPRTGVHMK